MLTIWIVFFSSWEEGERTEQLSVWTDSLAKCQVKIKTVQKHLEEAEIWGNKISEWYIKINISLLIYQDKNKRTKQIK